jgi:hypothetical protein
MNDMLNWLQKHDDYFALFRSWLLEFGVQTPAEAVTTCPRGAWLLWLAKQLGYDPDERVAAVRPTLLRALREHTPTALDAAQLRSCATVLRSLPDDVDATKAAREVAVAELAAKAARETEATKAAAAAAADTYGAWCSSPAAAAGWAAGAAEWAEWAQEIAAERTAWRAEHARCADEVRAALPDLAARWSAAMEAAP